MSSSLVEFSKGIADAVEQAGASVTAILEGGREGVSGTLWQGDLVVTAEHTIRGHEEVTVVLPDGEQQKARVAGRDPSTDLAMLRVANKANGASIADDSKARVGEVVLSIARRGTEGLAATYGVISAISGPWRTWHGGRIDRWFRLDLNRYTGFSGGPIINARGEVLGIATSGPRHSIVTIPSSTVHRVVEQLLKGGRVSHGYLGIGVQPVALPENTRQALGTSIEAGLLIITVASGSSAEKAGLLLGDIILRAEGTALSGFRGLQSFLDPEYVGKNIRLEVLRAGKLIQVSVVVGEKPRR